MNAHPHAAGSIALVHNGIIENHLDLKRKLEEGGIKFASDTDTEIVAHLINREVQSGADLLTSVRRALGMVHGAYAVAVIDEREPDRIVVAKNASPLVIGFGDGEMFCASDIPAILPYTRNMLLLEEGDIALLTAGGVEITERSLKPDTAICSVRGIGVAERVSTSSCARSTSTPAGSAAESRAFATSATCFAIAS